MEGEPADDLRRDPRLEGGQLGALQPGSRCLALDDSALEAGPSQVIGRGAAGRAAAEDDSLLATAHHTSDSWPGQKSTNTPLPVVWVSKSWYASSASPMAKRWVRSRASGSRRSMMN